MQAEDLPACRQHRNILQTTATIGIQIRKPALPVHLMAVSRPLL